MPPKNEKRGRGGGKRPRDSPREGQGHENPSPGDYAARSTPSSQLGPGFGQVNPTPGPARAGSWDTGNNSSSSGGQSMQPLHAITSHPPPGKVAIPALRQPQNFDPSGKGSKKGRTSHACDFCRKAKAGCTGEQPCARCKAAGAECVYGDGKREQDRKMLTKLNQESQSLTQHNMSITEALRRIQLDTSLSYQGLRAAIDGVIVMSPPLLMPGSQFDSVEATGKPSLELGEQGSSDEQEDEGSDDIGSTGSLDVINVDTDRDDTRATGHMGKTSAVAWAKRTNEEIRRDATEEPGNQGVSDLAFAQASYHVEDADVDYVDTANVNPYDWPEYNLADALIRLYFENTHDAFPILEKAAFLEKYNSFERGSSDLTPSKAIVLGTINLVFAIGAVFADLNNGELQLQVHVDDQLVYVARARLLCPDQSWIIHDPRISTTRLAGLLSLYYLSVCQLNRSWALCGIGIRHALTLGLHVRSEAKNISDIEKEHRVRLWWALYSLEVFLDQLTGRPSCISDRDISTPLPVNVDENDFFPNRPLYKRDSGRSRSGSRGSRTKATSRPSATYQMPVGYWQPEAHSLPVVELPVTSSTYFIYRTQLSIITHDIVTQLYCPATIKQTWSEVQEAIRTINRRLVQWKDSLPPEFNIMFDTWAEPDWEDIYTLPRFGLAMFYNSSRMRLFRPCLCRVDGRLDNQSTSSKNFERDAVEHCISSARRMIHLIAMNARTESKFYAVPPWWHTLHYVCEALSVLMLEMAFKAQHLPHKSADILADAKQGIFWLAMLSAGSIAARKAWEIFDNLIRVVAPKIKWSVFDLPTTAPIPARYNWRRFEGGKDNAHVNATTQFNQLSQANLSSYQSTQAPLPDSATTIWASHTGPSNQYMSHFPSPPRVPEKFSNPLNRTAAVERFGNMGQMYRHYDDAWQQLLTPAAPGAAGPSGLGSGMGSYMAGVGGGVPGGMPAPGYLPQAGFERGMGSFETLSPTVVPRLPQGVFETEEERERALRTSVGSAFGGGHGRGF